jgi:hypothetical protein
MLNPVLSEFRLDTALGIAPKCPKNESNGPNQPASHGIKIKENGFIG